MKPALLLVALVLLPAVLGRFGRFFAAEILTWALYAMGFNICFGMAGMLSFGHAAFFAFGAYGATFSVFYIAREMKHGKGGAVGAGGEEGRVAERQHAGHAEADVEAHRVERPREDLRGEEPAEPAEAGR